MQQFYIGDSQQYITAQYAKSGRSTCRQCKQKITKEQLRIGLLLDKDDYAASYWYHMNCFHFNPRHKALSREKMEEKIYGIEDLNPEDCDKVVEYLKEEFENFRENKSGRKKSKKNKIDEVQKEEEKEDISAEPEEKNNKGKKTLEKIINPLNFKSTDQKKKYNEYFDHYSQLSAYQLKEILHQNNQAKTGTKEELAAKCADGKLLGKIPNCSKCGGGKLRFNRKNGQYKCPGYMEDTDFINCGAKFQFDEAKREKWVE